MKICLQSDQYVKTLSGIGTHTQNMVNGMIENGHEVVLLSNENIRHERKKGLTYEHIPSWSWDPNHGKWFSFSINTNKRIKNIEKKEKIDIFHSLDAREGSLAAKNVHAPTLGSINDYYFAVASKNPFAFYGEYKADWLRRYLNYNFTHFYEKFTLKNFDMLIANSRATRDEIVKNYGFPEDKIKVLAKAISEFPKKRNTIIERKNGKYKILMVGAGLQRKGIFYLIKAAPIVLRKFPNAEFVIVGKAGERIKSECRKEGILSSFDFRGVMEKDNIRELYRSADLFVLPSLIEGFGLSIIEAMSFGNPCICSDVGGIKDILDGKNGLRIPPMDETIIAKTIIDLLGDRAKRESISRNAFKDSRKYNVKDQIKNTLRIYESVLRNATLR